MHEEVRNKYENCPQCTGLREEFREKVKRELYDLPICEATYSRDGKMEELIKRVDVLTLLNKDNKK